MTTTKKKNKKELTVQEYWEEKGIPYSQIDKIIDMFEEGHEISEAAKSLISTLDDYAFDLK